MKILAILDLAPGLTATDLAAGQVEEQRALWGLYVRGVVREMYLRGDQPGAVLTLECEGTAAATAALDELPFVKDGRLRARLIELKPFARLERLWTETKPTSQ